ncbi:hypothetical protein BDR26DRAFT_864498 [Obelidium mucronatum]|nr:hypothetical protein BDR26DRAFT_864498 [Obelidium mucronatum]
MQHANTRERTISVGPGFVWIGTSIPYPVWNGSELLGPNYNVSLIEYFVFVFRTRLRLDTVNFLNGLNAFDCIGLLAHGIHKAIGRTSVDFVSQRQAQSLLNFTAFQNTGYNGFISSPVELDDGGDPALPYVAFQMTRDFQVMPFASTDSTALKITYLSDIHELKFPGNTTIPPPDGPIHTESIILRTDPTGRFIFWFQISGYILSLLDGIVILAFRNNEQIRSGSITFSIMTLFGAVLGFFSSGFIIDRLTPEKCAGLIWSSSLSFAIVACSLSIKNARVGMIFSAKSIVPKRYLKDQFSLVLLFGFVVLEFLLLGLSYQPGGITVSTFLLGDSIEFTCSTPSGMFKLCLIAYHIFLSILSLAATYMIRNVSGIHSEFSYMALLSASTFLFLSIEFMLEHQQSVSPMTQRFTHAAVVWLLLMEVVLFKFVSRVMALWSENAFDVKNLSIVGSSGSRGGEGTGGAVVTDILRRMSLRPPSENAVAPAPVASQGLTAKSQSTMLKPGKSSRKNTVKSVKGVSVTYRMEGRLFQSEWILALCVLCRVRENLLVLMIPANSEVPARGFNIDKQDYKPVNCNGDGDGGGASTTTRISISSRANNSKVLIDFNSVERANDFYADIFK